MICSSDPLIAGASNVSADVVDAACVSAPSPPDRKRPILGHDLIERAEVAHRRAERQAGRLHVGPRAHAIEQTPKEHLALRVRVSDVFGIHPYVQHAIRIETEIEVLGLSETLYEQTGDNEQHERSGDLADDEQTP